MRHALLLLPFAFASSSALAVVGATEATHANTRGHEHLDALKVIRGARTADKVVTVTAEAGEGWTATAIGGFLSVSPSTHQSGPGRVTVSFSTETLTGNGPFTGEVVITPDTGSAVLLPVNLDVWPRDLSDLTPAQTRDRAFWVSDGDFGGSWELWGFLPDDTSHPGENAGALLDAPERTPCTGGSMTGCTRAGQAGLAAGQSADRAWMLSRGDPRVMVAVLDSGIRWHERALIDKAYLNARELAVCPPPGATAASPATFDVNHDGVFNVRDYDWADPAYADVNGNGRLDPQDLIHGHNPANNTPCSDDVDDDLNGYVDDISGWDFFWNDNDPSDDTDYGHGTGEAKDSVAQGHDDTGAVGICMRCTLLNVRVGDSFMADINQFAEGVAFSVDSGASVVQEALGTVNNTPFAQQAITYAWEHNVLVVGSAADETSRHHNYPANLDHLINVHAVLYDTDGQPGGWRRATTFLNFNNCTNYGGHLQLSTPGGGCSSEATGKTSGQTGLLYSYYRQLQDGADTYYDIPLTAAEAFQVLIGSADDIDVEGAEADPGALSLKKYVSNEGWDEAFGYGRNNARRMLEMVRDRRIPPEAYIESPKFFEQFDPDVTPQIAIAITVGNRRFDSVAWKVEAAPGVAPRETDFVPVGDGTHAQAGTLTTTVNMSASLIPRPDVPSADVDAYTVTLRLTATGTQGTDTVRGEFRKTISVRKDPQRRRALALDLNASGEASPRFSDVDGDGRDELVLAVSDGRVHAFRADGSELPGWPVKLNHYRSFSDETCTAADAPTRRRCHRSAPAYQQIDVTDLRSATVSAASLADLDGDGAPEKDVVVSDLDGYVYAFSAAGQLLPGFPVHMNPDHVSEFIWGKYVPTEERFAEQGFFAQPVLVDMDGDGDLEIVLSGMDQWVYAWNHDGTEVNGWPVHVENTEVPVGRNGRFNERIIAPVTVAFLDDDELPELVVGTEEIINNTSSSYLYALDHRGNAAPGGAFMPGWPTMLNGFVNDVLPYVGKGMPNAVAAADLDGDGKDEVMAASMGGPVMKLDGQARPFGLVQATEGSREYFGPAANTTENVVASLINNPTVADLDQDGMLDVINGTAGLQLAGAAESGGQRIPFQHSVSAWNLESGYQLDGFPQVVEDYQFFMNYAVGDIDGDGAHEAVMGSGVYLVHAFNPQGEEPEGWPKNTHGWVITTPALGDLDGDNKMEVAVNTREGWLFVWDMPGTVQRANSGAPNPIQWPGYHHDERNTGNIRTALQDYGMPHGLGLAPCGCRSSSSSDAPLAWTLLGLAALVWRRRRR
ncbi:MAG: hypothetical protein HY904_10585 [Deltaproteobacteria bacterium]|nr:hypothetical protein [Deltaproteobacteria bacterium]